MRTLLSVPVLFAVATGCATTQGANPPAAEPAPAAAPAAKAPAKEFSMRTYYMALLRRGPAWTKERTPEAIADGKGHMANIERLAKCGKLVIAGPFNVPAEAPADSLAGIFIFDVATHEEALALTQQDPAVKSGRFTIEVLPWYGPTGLTYEGHIPADPNVSCMQ
ncbi:YciI family protein [Pyxidicoccus xibeiensis]|uniref:YciI family protein n=1 Tax=Pyxidicoccus xibeiensis TaxID=2906759 RepID=UPI0020A82CB0|nr:YciI family protein [Pyxidicoccus xibeiensis]MCP3142667.1 YciI family protein [Pyxidicoccus xibeiensis]